MICHITGKMCNRKKPFHITEIEKNKITSFNLCGECINHYMKNNSIMEVKKMDKNMTGFIESILNHLDKSEKPNPFGNKTCSACNSSLVSIYKKGKFGCPDCYKNFNLDNLLTEIHGGGTHHVGKVPKKWKAKQEKKQKELKLANIHETAECILKNAINTEDYETAAIIRDSIKKLDEFIRIAEIIGAEMKTAIENKDLPEAEKSKIKLDKLLSQCEQIQNFISGF